jgi:hypothetical protein
MSAPQTYKDFVRNFLAQNKQDGLTPKERMGACAKAWKALSSDQKSVSTKAVKKSSGSEGVTKKKNAAVKATVVKKEAEDAEGVKSKASHAHKTIVSGFDVGGLLSRFEQQAENASKKSASSLVIRRTKSNQRALNNVARAFSRDVKTGQVKSVNEAFMRGLKAVFDLQHGKATATASTQTDADVDVSSD